MRQLVAVPPGVVEWQEAPDPPPPEDGDALVRPLAVARCDLDPIMVAFDIFPLPYPVGHEIVAEVVAVGPDVVDRRVGDRVVVPFQVSCGRCDQCIGGRFAGCRRHRARAGAAFGFGRDGGGHGGGVADLLAVPHADHLLLPAPGGLAASTVATLPDNVVDGYRAVGPHLGARPGADVLVVGGTAASIGLYATAWAIALGAGSVRYVDGDDGRLSAASAMGAEAVAHHGPWPRRFDRAPITVDNSGDAEGLAATVRSTDDYGECTSVVIHFDPLTPVPLLEMYTRGVTLHTSRADSRRHLPAVLTEVEAGRFDPRSTPTTVVDWEVADEAWLEPATKLVVSRGD